MSTRRARIKAVTALPPRRKNADSAKKKEEEVKEGCESSDAQPSNKLPTECRQSIDKSPKVRRVSTDSIDEKHTNEESDKLPLGDKQSIGKTPISKDIAQEDAKEELEAGISQSTRRLSIDKTQGECLVADDKTRHATPEVYDSESKTAETSVSLDKPPVKSISLEVENLDQTLFIEKPVQDSTVPAENNNSLTTVPNNKTEVSASKTHDSNSWFPESKILHNLLKGREKSPKIFPPKSPTSKPTNSKDKEMVSLDNSNPSTNKEIYDSSENNLKTSKVPIFLSPQDRASPQRQSPIVRTPVIAVDLVAEKLIAPHKGPNSVGERNYMEMHAADVSNISKREVEIIIEKIVDKTDLNDLKTAVTLNKKPKCPIKIIDEYIIKPIPETATVMDGIVPLQAVSKAPKPLDLLKNEIISENAEVLFDPIVPLPSPSKVRPKLRPVPRLGPRRNSFQQGSASESEDENRRLHGRPATPATPITSRQRHDSHTSHVSTIVQRDVARVRNDSVCSNLSQTASHATTNSPLREREKSQKTRREEMTARRNAALRRRHKEVERDKLTMYDYIFYNPKDNPIIPDQDEIKAKEASKKEEDDRKTEATNTGSKDEAVPEATTTSTAAAVPQIKLGPNGEIILDEQSLIVNQSDQRKLDSTVVREGAWGGSGSRAYRRTPRTAEWSDAETVRFYRALATMGTDFTLMQPLFPTRTRRDLKLKFKKEERMNIAQVDKALRSGAEWDPMRLEKEFADERKAAEEEAKKAKERLKREKEEEKERARDMKHLGLRQSRSTKILGNSVMPQRFSQCGTVPASLDDYVKLQEELNRKPQRSRKRKQDKDLDAATKGLITTPLPTNRSPSPSMATLTLLGQNPKLKKLASKPTPNADMATITKEVSLPTIPPNIETGSLVVLTVNDPQSPSRKMLQTYIAQGPGNLAPVSLPANLLNSVVGFMKKSNSPKPTLMGSPSTPRSRTPNILSPRKRTSSYTITQL